jgi:hypothetical protein
MSNSIAELISFVKLFMIHSTGPCLFLFSEILFKEVAPSFAEIAKQVLDLFKCQRRRLRATVLPLTCPPKLILQEAVRGNF